jgi:hypothetical protein
MGVLLIGSTQDVLIDMTSGDFDTYLFLYERDGTLISEDDDGGFYLNFHIDVTIDAGRYLVLAAAFSAGDVGNYELSVSREFYAATASNIISSDFYALDAATGAESLIGPIGLDHMSAMDFHPTSGVLYGVAERSAADTTKVLITINPDTGAGTEVGPLGITSRWRIQGMSFRDDGVLFVHHGEETAHAIYTVNVS